MRLSKSYGIALGWPVAGGQVGAPTSPGADRPTIVTRPIILGEPRAGEALTSIDGVWSNGPILSRVRQWYQSTTGIDGWIPIAGATGAGLALGSGLVGRWLRRGEWAVSAAGLSEEEAYSNPYGPVESDVPADLPEGVLAKIWGPGVWSLSAAGQTGPRSAPTKSASDSGLYPAGASLGGTGFSFNRTITLGGSGGVFEGFILDGQTINVTAPGWTIQDCTLKGFQYWDPALDDGAGGWVNASYDIQTNQDDTIIRFCGFDGAYGVGCKTAVAVNGAGRRIKIYRNKMFGYLSDDLKFQSTVVGVEKPEAYENHLGVGGWGLVKGPHFDAITVANGGAYIHGNLIDLTSYIDPDGTQKQNPPIPVNPPPADAPPNFYTWGLTNALRVQGQTGSVIDDVVFTQNIVLGHRRGGPNVFQVAPPEVTETVLIDRVDLSDNVVEPGYLGALFHPNNATSADLTFNDNVRFSDGAVFTSILGETAVVPGVPIIADFVDITAGGARVVFDRGPGATYPGAAHQFSVSSIGPDSGFSEWATLPTTHIIPGLTGLTQYWVKLRASNGNGIGPESLPATVVTLESNPSIFVVADNAAAAWSRVTALPADTGVRKLAILIDVQVDTRVAGRYFIDGATGNGTYVNMPATGQVRAQIQGSSVTRATANFTTPAGNSFRMVWTFDYTVPGTADGGAISDGVKLTIDGEVQDVSGTTHDTQAGLRPLSIASILSNLGIMATAGGTGILDGRVKAIALNWGGGDMVLPDISSKAAFDTLFDDDHVEATLAGWKLFYATSVPGEVGASDGSTANTWNAAGGLNNRGTVPSKPAIVQGGRYS